MCQPPVGTDEFQEGEPLSHPDYFGVGKLTSVRELMEARVHYGHKYGCWNPLMKPHLAGQRCGIHIIDLDQTYEHLVLALNVTAHIAHRNGMVLFVNERPQFEKVVQQAARACGEYFYTQPWKGGTLSNAYMFLKVQRLPDLILFLSVPPSFTAIREAAMCCVPSVGIVDSDCNPNLILYPVPGNDDSPSALRLYCRVFHDAINLGKAKRKEDKEKEKEKEKQTEKERLNVL